MTTPTTFVLVSALAWALLWVLLALDLREHVPAYRKWPLGLTVGAGFGVGLLAGAVVALLLLAVRGW